MRHILILISISVLLSACMHDRYQTIEIIGKEGQNEPIFIRGMGVKLPDGGVLTSAHVVRDDRLRYEIEGARYRVRERDSSGDRAVLEKSDESHILPLLGGVRGGTQQIPLLASSMMGGIQIQKGDPIYTEVSRSGSIVRIAGKVVDPVGSVTGYDMIGRVVTLSGIVLTDIDLQPGDSGAPIYTTLGQVVDVVHVR